MLEGSKMQLNRNSVAKVDTETYQATDEDILAGGDVVTNRYLPLTRLCKSL